MSTLTGVSQGTPEVPRVVAAPLSRLSANVRWASLLVPLWEARFDELTEIWETGRVVPGIKIRHFR